MSDLLLIGCIAALGAAVGIAAVLLADRVSDFFGFYRKQFSRNAEIEMAGLASVPMNLADLSTLYNYNYWANQRILWQKQGYVVFN